MNVEYDLKEGYCKIKRTIILLTAVKSHKNIALKKRAFVLSWLQCRTVKMS